ncbi:MAG TPA: MotA/TolQ/ExbB proton channel family protein [Candidatus Hydrogenedentes bacterium]|mgnify:FL=1|nr:MotA/TolQ/ExbB proton channel family protein [Candidatus Hydrogenedentota bacterium]HOJ69263.1 MotA/TolQ/ExbB proton channel family protein [Candidatus Hydrogenedentota bacterium]HOK90683.1 MotA/TolQ/ExbB proton channel family protein [Candidatus Hydrogenedentota bacterium]HPO30345.1 MotA/TolQ/ExbB proton channel family protein [Candidatus Hydrogenedentota bacterium]
MARARWFIYLVLLGIVMAAGSMPGWGQAAPDTATAPGDSATATPTVQTAAPGNGESGTSTSRSPESRVPERLTLMMMIRQGGIILWITMALGFIGLALAIYLLITLNVSREVPASFVKRAHAQLRAGDLKGAFQMCQDREETIAKVLRAGLKMAGHDRYVVQEAMESEGERAASALWQKVSYLNNIATVAPLLGLLGTVWGMMQAFSSIALDAAQVKGLTMAYSVSQAMITTAGGLIVAIPCMMIYFYLRGRVLRIIAELEAQASEFVELITTYGGDRS